jgi:predicted PhzF superfamily epimerase YddE/YHI9
MSVQITQVDAFTTEPFRGNPAGVCILDAWPSEAWLQAVAREMNVSETTFAVPEGDGWRVRWFTPTVEIPLCGHGTLSLAHELFRRGAKGPLAFESHGGPLTARAVADVTRGEEPKVLELADAASVADVTRGEEPKVLELDFPALPPAPVDTPPDLAAALGGAPIISCGHAGENLLLEVDDVRGLKPDFRALTELTPYGYIVSMTSDDPDYDVISRYFAPAHGIDEDPVTGSAHCTIGPYFAKKLGKTTLRCLQASERSGTMTVIVKGDRVLLRGQAITVLEGQLLTAPS